MLFDSKTLSQYEGHVAAAVAKGEVPCWPPSPYPAPPDKYPLGAQLPPNGNVRYTADQINEVLALFRTALIKWGLTKCADGTTEEDLTVDMPQLDQHRGQAVYVHESVTRSLSLLMDAQIAKVVQVSGRPYAEVTGWAMRAHLTKPLGPMPMWPMYPLHAETPAWVTDQRYTAAQLKASMKHFQHSLVDWAMYSVAGLAPHDLYAALPVVAFDTPDQPPVYTRESFEAAYREVTDLQLALLAAKLNTSVLKLLNPK